MLTDFSEENLRRLCYNRESFLLQCPKTKLIRVVKFDGMDSDTFCIVSTKHSGGWMYVTKRGYRHVYNDGQTVVTTIADYSNLLESQDFSIEYFR